MREPRKPNGDGLSAAVARSVVCFYQERGIFLDCESVLLKSEDILKSVTACVIVAPGEGVTREQISELFPALVDKLQLEAIPSIEPHELGFVISIELYPQAIPLREWGELRSALENGLDLRGDLVEQMKEIESRQAANDRFVVLMACLLLVLAIFLAVSS